MRERIRLTTTSPLANTASELSFDFERGSIEFSEKRVAFLHMSLYGKIIGKLVELAGPDTSARVLLDIGRDEGAKYYKGNLPIITRESSFGINNILYLHSIAGMSSPEIVSLYSTEDEGFYCEIILNNSFEAEAYSSYAGKSTHPVCCIQVGHLSELVSQTFGRDIVFVETECQAMGSEVCRVVGTERTADGGGTKVLPLPIRSDAAPKIDAGTERGPKLVGSSPIIRSLTQNARRAAVTNASILIAGETGVGKEQLARSIHFFSKRRNLPFVAVNCGALPRDLIEAEMFGVAKGAYTGAVAARAGRFERADCGTLFLDEVGTLPLDAQVKLLRVLEDGLIERLGDTQVRQVDVRVIAATNLDLRAEVKAGRFRSDLYHRLAVFPIYIPALRDRTEDIPALIAYLLPRAAAKLEKEVAGISEPSVSYLMSQPWEGNVRELQHRLERAIILAEAGEIIEIHHVQSPEDNVSSPLYGSATSASPSEGGEGDVSTTIFRLLSKVGSVKEIERLAFEAALDHYKGNRSRAAAALGFTRSQMAYRTRQLSHPCINPLA